MSALILSNGTYSVDLTQSASITRSASNPVIVIPIPTGPDAASFGGAVAINLKMMTQRIDIKFSLTTGVGSHSYSTPVTDYEKLWYMMTMDENAKTLSWEGMTFTVQMDSLTTPTAGGGYKLMEQCSVGLVIVNP